MQPRCMPHWPQHLTGDDVLQTIGHSWHLGRPIALIARELSSDPLLLGDMTLGQSAPCSLPCFDAAIKRAIVQTAL